MLIIVFSVDEFWEVFESVFIVGMCQYLVKFVIVDEIVYIIDIYIYLGYIEINFLDEMSQFILLLLMFYKIYSQCGVMFDLFDIFYIQMNMLKLLIFLFEDVQFIGVIMFE